MELGEKDLLQADATILAGILILLTISANLHAPSSGLTKFIFYLAIAPFMGSIYMLLDTRWGTADLRMGWAKGLTMFGLIVLLGAVGMAIYS